MKTAQGEGWKLYVGDTVLAAREMESYAVGYLVYAPAFASIYTYSAADEDMGNCASHAEFFAQYEYLIEQQRRVMKPGRNISIHCMLMPT